MAPRAHDVRKKKNIRAREPEEDMRKTRKSEGSTERKIHKKKVERKGARDADDKYTLGCLFTGPKIYIQTP